MLQQLGPQMSGMCLDISILSEYSGHYGDVHLT